VAGNENLRAFSSGSHCSAPSSLSLTHSAAFSRPVASSSDGAALEIVQTLPPDRHGKSIDGLDKWADGAAGILLTYLAYKPNHRKLNSSTGWPIGIKRTSFDLGDTYVGLVGLA
jgi:hypothetical protein